MSPALQKKKIPKKKVLVVGMQLPQFVQQPTSIGTSLCIPFPMYHFFWQKEKDKSECSDFTSASDVSDDDDMQDKGADDGADDKGVSFGSSLPFSAPDLSGVFYLLDKRLVVKFPYMQQQSVTDHYNNDVEAVCVKDKKTDGKKD